MGGSNTSPYTEGILPQSWVSRPRTASDRLLSAPEAARGNPGGVGLDVPFDPQQLLYDDDGGRGGGGSRGGETRNGRRGSGA